MGITGLLPLLKPVTKDTHIRELKGLYRAVELWTRFKAGKVPRSAPVLNRSPCYLGIVQGVTVGIDTYCWLHKGIYSCSAELCQGIPTDKFIKYCVERVHLLLRHGVIPYLVFDGGYLPAKAGKEKERRTKREANLHRGMQLLREGDSAGAQLFFCKAADVTPFMAYQLIQVIKRIPSVKYVVAPYEADAQLGFLARNGHVDCVITEDSDIILFGCTRVLFKLVRDGTGQEVDLREVFSRRNDELDMRGMTEDDLMTLCALSGCDYLPSVPGVGLKKAHRLVSRHRELPRILRAVKFEAPTAFPPGYEADFHRALLTFRHQRAFDPVSRTVVHMTPLPETLPSVLTASKAGDTANVLAFLGPSVDKERGCAVADADIDPITGENFSDMTDGKPRRGGGAAIEAALSESAANALAAWRGTTPTAGSNGRKGGRSSSKHKKLCGQENNLTKYWGTPLASSSAVGEIASGTESDGTNGGRGRRVNSGGNSEKGGGQAMAVDRSFKEDPTSRRECDGRDATVGRDGGDGAIVAGQEKDDSVVGTPEGRGALCRRFDGKQVDLLQGLGSPPSCVSPGDFYHGFSPSPDAPTPSSARAFPEYNALCDDNENQDPTLLLDEKPKTVDDEHPSSTSKHFNGGSIGSSGVARSGRLPRRNGTITSSAAGLRRRFRSPLVSTNTSGTGANNSWSASADGPRATPGGLLSSSCDNGRCERDIDVDPADPWRAKSACSSAPTSNPLDSATATKGVEGGQSGGEGRRGGGRGLKRRRTLGVGSVAPMGLLRGLNGVMSGAGLAPWRSRSLGGNGGVVSATRHGGVGTSPAVSDDAAFGRRENVVCEDNMFERFARFPQEPCADSRTGLHDIVRAGTQVEARDPAGVTDECPTSLIVEPAFCRASPDGDKPSSTAADSRNDTPSSPEYRNSTTNCNIRRKGNIFNTDEEVFGKRRPGNGPLSERYVNTAVSSCVRTGKGREGRSSVVSSIERENSEGPARVGSSGAGGVDADVQDIFARFVYTA